MVATKCRSDFCKLLEGNDSLEEGKAWNTGSNIELNFVEMRLALRLTKLDAIMTASDSEGSLLPRCFFSFFCFARLFEFIF